MVKAVQKVGDFDPRQAERFDKKIQVLEQGSDLKSVFDEDEIGIIEAMGHATYLAHLKRVRQSLDTLDLSE